MAYIETIVECYLLTTPKCDIDFLFKYYHDDVVMITPEGIKQGKMEARIFVTNFYGNPVPGYPDQFELISKQFVDDVAYLVWRCGEALPFVAETFVIKGGLITRHTIAFSKQVPA